MWISLAFFLIGFLVGNLAGLSATSVVAQLIGLFFVLAGGSVIAFLKKLGPEDRKIAGRALFAIALGCLLGVYISIAVVQWQLFSPPGASKDELYFPLRTLSAKKIVSKSRFIDAQYRARDLTAEEAYQKIYKLIQEGAENDAD